MPSGGMKSSTGWWKVEPTAERLRELLSYDTSTGVFVWRYSRRGISGGKTAGCVSNGYSIICVDGLRYYAHRLAWLYCHGEWPKGEVDHINRNRSDNSISNLRLASSGQNKCNAPARKNNRCGYKGVFLHQPGKWRARIGWQGKYRHLGVFDTPEAAAQAYREAALKLHGDFAG